MTKKMVRSVATISRYDLDEVTLAGIKGSVDIWIGLYGSDAKLNMDVGDYYMDITIESSRLETDEQYAARLESEAAAAIRQQESKEHGERAMLAQLKAKYGE